MEADPAKQQATRSIPMPRKSAPAATAPVEQAQPAAPVTGAQTNVSGSELAQALIYAIESTRPQKKHSFNRKVETPWTPKDGTKKPKLKRSMYQHGLRLDEDFISPTEVTLMNELRPGVYLGGIVRVTRRKDRGIDISYPARTASQRLKLVNQFGVRNLTDLLTFCIEESKNPAKNTTADED